MSDKELEVEQKCCLHTVFTYLVSWARPWHWLKYMTFIPEKKDDIGVYVHFNAVVQLAINDVALFCTTTQY